MSKLVVLLFEQLIKVAIKQITVPSLLEILQPTKTTVGKQ